MGKPVFQGKLWYLIFFFLRYCYINMSKHVLYIVHQINCLFGWLCKLVKTHICAKSILLVSKHWGIRNHEMTTWLASLHLFCPRVYESLLTAWVPLVTISNHSTCIIHQSSLVQFPKPIDTVYTTMNLLKFIHLCYKQQSSQIISLFGNQ